MQQRRRSSLLRRRRACDLSIYGDAIATPAAAPSTAYNQITGEMDIEAVHQACTPLTAAARTSVRASTAGDVRGRTCRRSSPECCTQRSLWDFDPFLKDDTGRMISTKTAVAKMTAPISPVKVPRVDRAAARQRNASRSDAVSSSGKSNNDKEIAAAEQEAGKLDVNNSSNKSKRLAAEMTTAASVVQARTTDVARKSHRSSSSGKLKDDRGVADAKQLADGFDENNSSNKAKPTSRRSSGKEAGVKPRGGKSDRRNSAGELKEETEDEQSLPKADVEDVETSLSQSMFQPDEKRRRSPSLQVLYV